MPRNSMYNTMGVRRCFNELQENHDCIHWFENKWFIKFA